MVEPHGIFRAGLHLVHPVDNNAGRELLPTMRNGEVWVHRFILQCAARLHPVPTLSRAQPTERNPVTRTQAGGDPDTVESELSALPQNATLHKNRQLIDQPTKQRVV